MSTRRKGGRGRGPKKSKQYGSGGADGGGKSGPRGRSGQGGRRGGPRGAGPQEGGGRPRPRQGDGERGGQTHRGKVQKNPRGFAFILPSQAEFEDVFVDARQAAQLMEGDIVEFSIVHRGPRSSARIERILERRTHKIVGQLQGFGRNVELVGANNQRFALAGEPKDAQTGDWVIANMEEYPNENRPGYVRVQQSFGKHLTPKNDVPITIARYGLPDEFSEGVEKDAERYRQMAREEIASKDAKRRDQRNLAYITIDGEDAKDFDDAVFVEAHDKGYTLYVAIADVSFFVRPGTALDKEAKARATSVYFPGVCIPMLPEYLSNDLCSLRPQEDKLAMTAEMHFNSAGVMEATKFYSSLIKTARRCTYTEIQAFVDKDPLMTKTLAPLSMHLKNAYELFRKMEDQRKKRGVLEFKLPESKIEVDKDGRPVSVKKAPSYSSHKLIEEFMVAANRAVAKHLRETKQAALYRVHEAPDTDALDELNLLMKNLGMPGRISENTPRGFAEVLTNTEKLPAANTLHQAILRMMKQARYMPKPLGHFGLSLQDYAHFTSPIRRYPDLVVHRALNGLTPRARDTDKRPEGVSSEEDFDRLGEHTSDMERRATEAERFIVKRKQCWYFLDRIGDEFDGTVSGVHKNGLFVYLGEMAAEGFVPMEFMDGFYELDERRNCLRRRPGSEMLSVGDPIRVQVLKVSIDENQITLGMAKKK